MKDKNTGTSISNLRRKELIRNIIIAIALVLLIAAIILVLLSKNNTPTYTDVQKNNLQSTDSKPTEVNSSDVGQTDNKIDLDNLPKVPIEPAQ